MPANIWKIFYVKFFHKYAWHIVCVFHLAVFAPVPEALTFKNCAILQDLVYVTEFEILGFTGKLLNAAYIVV